MTRTQDHPATRYAALIGFDSSRVLDFGVRRTPLVRADRLVDWLGVGTCHLKLETTHPTGTVKDRATELLYSLFAERGITEFCHTSTGNTGSSLAWGLGEYRQAMKLHVVVPGDQREYHALAMHPGLRTVLLEDASYDQARAYLPYYERTISGYPAFDRAEIRSFFRHKSTQIPYLEAYEELAARGERIDVVAQTISGGYGLVGAYLAAETSVRQGWLASVPALLPVQPVAANPFVACYLAGNAQYDSRYTRTVAPSRAYAVRRGDQSDCYDELAALVRESGGSTSDATEEEIAEAQEALSRLEGIEAGFTACVALAGIRKLAAGSDWSRQSVLVMITGIDREPQGFDDYDEVVSKSDWVTRISGK